MSASGRFWRRGRETGSDLPILGAVLGLVVMLGGLGAALWAFQDRLIYFPDPTPPPPPALLGLDRVAETRLRTADGLDILAWNLPAGRGDAPVLLYLHGNGGSLAYRADRLRRFERRQPAHLHVPGRERHDRGWRRGRHALQRELPARDCGIARPRHGPSGRR
jgi:hypothetical protein